MTTIDSTHPSVERIEGPFTTKHNHSVHHPWGMTHSGSAISLIFSDEPKPKAKRVSPKRIKPSYTKRSTIQMFEQPHQKINKSPTSNNFQVSKNSHPSSTTLGTIYTNRLYVPSEKNVKMLISEREDLYNDRNPAPNAY